MRSTEPFHSSDAKLRCRSVQVVDYYSGRSFRLLALAVGVVQGVSCMNLAAASQQQMELRAGSLDVLGLVVLSNHLRSESQETIQHLQEK